jgi:site-specific recombinase XerD
MPSIKVRKFGNSVYVIYSHKHKFFKLFTGANVEDQYWNICTPIKTCPDYDNITLLINNVESSVLNALVRIRNLGIDPTIEFVKAEYLAQKAPGKTEQPFWILCDEYLNALTCQESTKRSIIMSRNIFMSFCDWSAYNFDIKTFDRQLFGRFVQYLLFYKHMEDSTIKRHVKWLRSFLKYAYPGINTSWVTYSPIPVMEEVISITEGELRQLIDTDLGGYFETTRDLFVFLATTGTRFHDSQLSQLTLISEKDILSFSKHNMVTLNFPPLYEASRRVLMKYDGIPPQISKQKFNFYIKELFEELELNRPVTTQIIKNGTIVESILPLSAVINSQIARNTFISLCLRKGMPVQHVMIMTGHNDYKSLEPYLRKNREHLRTNIEG